MNIGIDIGGSHIAIGVVDKSDIIAKKEIQIKDEDKLRIEDFIEKTIVDNINIILKELKLEINSIEKIGVSCPGTVIENKIVKNIVNLGIETLNIYDILKKYYKDVKITIGNDGKCAAIAEKKYGNMKQYNDCLFICLGTGVGGAVYINGKLLESKYYSGYEIGHMVIQKNGIKCNCGRKGCFDIYGSMKNFKLKLTCELGIDSNAISYDILPKLECEVSKNVECIINEYVHNVSIGIANLINIFEPEIVVIGGSFTYYQSILLEPIKKEIINKNMLINKRKDINIVAAKLFNDAGIIGAANM